ncbi:protein-export membrane protein SecD [Acetobacter orientalis]|uniref:Protein-export membrane protein SecD n=1 Tax=Acetobacter orientalis TaxID=146474 RepID=A0A2Z5ZCS9_9PROT|nr:protein-export membrane protein SecD [Acetobacter orientalis]
MGTHAFSTVTQANVGKRFAIVLDNKVIEAPVIRTAITGGSGQITGGFDAQRATDLALMLRAGALPAPSALLNSAPLARLWGQIPLRQALSAWRVVLCWLFCLWRCFTGALAGMPT